MHYAIKELSPSVTFCLLAFSAEKFGLKCGWQQLTPNADDKLRDWWLQSRKVVPKARRKAFDSLSFMVSRSLWLERNVRVFRNVVLLW
jgi:hypothetical protein